MVYEVYLWRHHLGAPRKKAATEELQASAGEVSTLCDPEYETVSNQFKSVLLDVKASMLALCV